MGRKRKSRITLQEPLSVAFTCKLCHGRIGDWLYQGGHGPRNAICYDCFVQEFYGDRHGIEQTLPELFLYLVAIGGYTKAEAAKKIGVHPTTASRWLRAIRNDPARIQEIISDH